MRRRALRVLLLEDSASDAELIEQALARWRHPVVIEHADCRDAFALALKEFLPDIVLSDHSLAQFDARAAVKMVQTLRPVAPVILVTGSVDPQVVVDACRAGIEDVVHKNNLAGLTALIEQAVSRRSALATLTPRQLQVLRYVADGLSTLRIAKRLNLSMKTIESHRGEIMRRLGIHDLVGLVRFAVSVRLVPADI